MCFSLSVLFAQIVNDYCLVVLGSVAPPPVFVVNLAPGSNKPGLRAPWARLLLQGDQ